MGQDTNEMTFEQQKRAAIYSVCFLRDEIFRMENLIAETESGDSRDFFVSRLAELEEDLQTFRLLRDQLRT